MAAAVSTGDKAKMLDVAEMVAILNEAKLADVKIEAEIEKAKFFESTRKYISRSYGYLPWFLSIATVLYMFSMVRTTAAKKEDSL